MNIVIFFLFVIAKYTLFWAIAEIRQSERHYALAPVEA